MRLEKKRLEKLELKNVIARDEKPLQWSGHESDAWNKDTEI